MAEVITYETLREIQRKEKQSEKLVDLDDGFYEKVRDYINRDVDDDVAFTELRNARIVLDDIQSRREKKTVYQALRSVRSDEKPSLDEMTSIEKDLFESLVDLLKDYHSKIKKGEAPEKQESQEKEEESEEEKETKEKKEKTAEKKKEKKKEEKEKENDSNESSKEGKDYIKVKILEDVPQIVGSDLKDYGPFEKGDIVELPPENAKIFINNGKAEEK